MADDTLALNRDQRPSTRPNPTTPTPSGGPVTNPTTPPTPPTPSQFPVQNFNESDDDPVYADAVVKIVNVMGVKVSDFVGAQKTRYEAEEAEWHKWVMNHNVLLAPNNIWAKYKYLYLTGYTDFKLMIAARYKDIPNLETWRSSYVSDSPAYRGLVSDFFVEVLSEPNPLGVDFIVRLTMVPSPDKRRPYLRIAADAYNTRNTYKNKILNSAYNVRFKTDVADLLSSVQNKAVPLRGNEVAYQYYSIKQQDIYRPSQKFEKNILAELIFRSVGYTISGYLTSSASVMDYARFITTEFAALYIGQDAIMDNTSNNHDIVPAPGIMETINQSMRFNFKDEDILPSPTLPILYRIVAEIVVVGGPYYQMSQSKTFTMENEKKQRVATALVKVTTASVFGVSYSIIDNYFAVRRRVMEATEAEHSKSTLLNILDKVGLGSFFEDVEDAADYAWTYKELGIAAVVAIAVVIVIIVIKSKSSPAVYNINLPKK